MNAPLMHVDAFKNRKTQIPGKVNLKELFQFAFCRIDQDDGRAYTQVEFAEYYGDAGEVRWKNALKVCSLRSLGICE